MLYASPYDSTTPDSKKLSPTIKVIAKNEAITCSKRAAASRQRNVRMSANVKSRAIVSTDSSTSDDGSPNKESTPKIESRFEETSLNTSDEFKLNTMNPIKNETQHQNSFSIHGLINSSSSDEIGGNLNNHQVRT